MNGTRHILGATTPRAGAALAAAIVVGLALFAAGNARAIVGGSADGGMHPNVAAVVYDGGFAGCSGFLVAPRIVVTAAHCIDIPEFLGFHAVGVSFAATADVAGAIPLAGIEIDPGWAGIKVFQKFAGLGLVGKSDLHDLAVLRLAADAPATAVPVRLPTLGLLDDLAAKGGLQGRSLTAVGYGTSDPAEFPQATSERRVAQTQFRALNQARLQVSMVSGRVCVGDSGSPALLSVDGHDVAVGLHSLIAADPHCHTLGDYYRLDTAEARDFLDDFVAVP